FRSPDPRPSLRAQRSNLSGYVAELCGRCASRYDAHGLPNPRDRDSVRASINRDRKETVAMASKIRVGIVGASPDRGFASISHVPALQALPDFEIVAVCTSSQQSADAAAKHY